MDRVIFFAFLVGFGFIMMYDFLFGLQPGASERFPKICLLLTTISVLWLCLKVGNIWDKLDRIERGKKND